MTALSTEQLRDAKAAIPYGERLSATAHLLAADASHALQDSALRDKHWQQAMSALPEPGTTQDQEIREGAQCARPAGRWTIATPPSPCAAWAICPRAPAAAQLPCASSSRLPDWRATPR